MHDLTEDSSQRGWAKKLGRAYKITAVVALCLLGLLVLAACGTMLYTDNLLVNWEKDERARLEAMKSGAPAIAGAGELHAAMERRNGTDGDQPFVCRVQVPGETKEFFVCIPQPPGDPSPALLEAFDTILRNYAGLKPRLVESSLDRYVSYRREMLGYARRIRDEYGFLSRLFLRSYLANPETSFPPIPSSEALAAINPETWIVVNDNLRDGPATVTVRYISPDRITVSTHAFLVGDQIVRGPEKPRATDDTSPVALQLGWIAYHLRECL